MRDTWTALRVVLLVWIPWQVIAAPPPAPGAGSLLQELKPVEPPTPESPDSGLSIESRKEANLPPSAPFPVKSIHLSGNTSFATTTLHALLADAEGHDLTLPELSERVSRISDFYHAHGYPLARALIPAQTIREGVVEVEIVEARYGQIIIENHSRVGDDLLRSALARLQEGQAIEQSSLDHTLLLLGDIPGVTPNATLQPGSAVATSNLLVQVVATPLITGLASVDNYGNRFTGGTRANGEAALYDPLHHGDVLDASVLTSGRDLNYGRLSYDILLDGEGTHLGAAYSTLHYLLGHSLADLEGHGTAAVTSLWARQPLIRTRDLNLTAQLEFDRKELRDHIDTSAIHTDRHLDNLTLSLSGDWRDSLLSGGATSGSLQWVYGKVGFDDAAAERADALTARTGGHFSQTNATFGRLQRISTADSLYLVVSGQWTNGNLDPSQKLVAGGRYTVRAYDMNALSADTGEQASVEWRHDLPRWHGQWQTQAFIDAQHVTINQTTWTGGKNDATLRGTGVGLNWSNPSRWAAQASIAWRLGSAPELISDASRTRGWIELSKGF